MLCTMTEIKAGLMILERKRGKLKELGSVRFGLFCLVPFLTAIIYISEMEVGMHALSGGTLNAKKGL